MPSETFPNTPNPTQDLKKKIENIFLENFQKFDGLHFFRKISIFLYGFLIFQTNQTRPKILPDFLIFFVLRII